MRLKAVVLENFRSYRKAIRIPIHKDITGVIGRNDVGKSSVLEALEIFFNNDTVEIHPSDLSVDAPSKQVRIACVFDELPASVVLDEAVETTLGGEHLLNAAGELEIVKIFKCQAKVSGPDTYIRALHPTADKVGNLLELKIDQLRTLGNELGVAGNVADQRKSALWRSAIWAAVPNLKVVLQDIDLSKLDSKAKSIFDKVESVLPTYFLFKSDRESSDADSEAKDPMQVAVKQALDDFKAEISVIEEKVSGRVREVAERTLLKLREMDSTLASSLMPTFKDKPKWTFNFTLESDRGIAVNKRGSGVRRLILLNFFRAEADRKAGGRTVIYAIEEPETSQHPNNQEMLVKALLDLARRPNAQVLVTTHVPALAGLLPTDSVLFVEADDANGPKVSFGSDDVIDRVARTLGVLPDRDISAAKALILVEDDAHIVFLKHSSKELKAAGVVSHSLSDKGIVPIPTGGIGNLKSWVTKKTADELKLPWGVLMDSDQDGTNPEEFQNNTALLGQLRASGVKAHMTRKREVENYIPPQFVHAQVNTPQTAALTYGDTDNAKECISQAVGIRSNQIFGSYWPRMTVADIVAAGSYAGSDGAVRNEIVELLNDFLRLA